MFNDIGVPINDAEMAMYNIKPYEKILSESGINNNITFLGAMAVGSAVSGFLGSRNKRKNAQRQANQQAEAAKRQFLNNVRQNAYKQRFDELMIETKNKRTMEEFDHRIKNYEYQKVTNRDALIGAFAAEQFKLNEVFEQAALNRNKQIKELIRVQGQQAAARGGNVSKSAERADMLNSLAEFGQEQIELDKTLYSHRQAYKQRMGAIAGQHANADYTAWSKIAIAPMLDLAPGVGPSLSAPPPAAKQSGGFFSDFSSAVTGFTGIAATAAPGSLDIGSL